MTRRRLWALGVVVGALALLSVVKLGNLQLREASALSAVGEAQRTREEEIQALRGSIVDRNGVELAVSVPRTTVAVSRKALSEAGYTDDSELEPLAVELAERLELDEPEVVGAILGAEPQDDDIVLSEDVDPEKAEAARTWMAELGAPGALGVRNSAERDHPAGGSALPVIGTLGPDGPAEMAGVEAAYDEVLRGVPGRLVVERGEEGETIIGSERILREPRPGRDVEVTLDRTLQYETERYLMAGASEAGASEGIAIIGKPGTGELLAVAGVEKDQETGEMELSSMPLAFSAAYPAGSVFKLVTAAASYEAGVVTRSREFTVPFSMQIEDWMFEDAKEHPTRQMTVDQIVAESSNVGTIQMALFLGSERLYRSLQDFGFGRRTGIHPAESSGLLPPAEDWTQSDLAAASIGTFQTTTAVQLWSAFNVIANRGLYVPPRLVSATIGPDGDRQETESEAAHRVVSTASATEVDRALRKVVEEGTGKQWHLPGYPVAAKTGTSRILSPEKVDPEDLYTWPDGRYHYVTTFAGYLPADRPQVSITVLLFDTAPGLTGSTAAGPVFSDLAHMSIRELAIAPSTGSDASEPAIVDGGDGGIDPALVAGDGRIRSAPASGSGRDGTAGGSTSTAGGSGGTAGASTSSGRTSSTIAGSVGSGSRVSGAAGAGADG